MAHGDRVTRLGHGKGYRQHLFARLCHGMIEHGHVCTQLARIKELRSRLEKLITLANRQTHIREVYRLLKRRGLNQCDSIRLVKEIAPKYKDRPGGYTSILHAGFNISGNPLGLLRMV